MPERTTVESIRGRMRELGPGLELAGPDFVYVGRRCTLGGWRIKDTSPFANPFKVRSLGPDGAVEEFRRYLRARPELVERIRDELHGKRLGCWCAEDQPCHARVEAEVADGADP